MKKIKEFTSNVENVAKNIVNSAIQSADQNDDGKFDLQDISIITESVGNTVKQNSQILKENIDEKARLLELKSLQPIFPESLDDVDFHISKFIRITDRDKKHAESKVCQGSIGYTSIQKGLRIVNIFRDSIEAFGLMFYPDSGDEFYYIDPSECDRYISLDEYFSYLKVARINELQKIAQDLGAKHFKVTYKEEQTSFSEKKMNAKTDAKALASIDAEHNSTQKKYSTVEIAAQMTFPGHAPVKPLLKYMQRDPSIQTLISMRMDEQAPLLHQKFMLKMSNSSGMKENDAAKIDAVLKGLKCSGNTTVSSEAKNEARRYLEYEIEF